MPSDTDPGTSPQIAFVGLGRMGLPMCTNLTRAGFAVVASDRRPQLEAAAVAAGARWATSNAAAVSAADVVITMLPGPPEVREAMLGADGILDALPSGATWIDMSSNSPSVARSLAMAASRRGIDVLEAPVGGGIPAAEAGTLKLFVGGQASVLDRHRVLLEVMAKPDSIWHMGGAGSGTTTKLLVNFLWFTQAIATGEALLMAKRAGIGLWALQSALTDSAAASEFLRRDVPALLGGDYLRTFGIERCYEELEGVMDLARESGLSCDLAQLVTDMHGRAATRFPGQDGELLAVALLEEESGTFLQELPDGEPAQDGGSAPAGSTDFTENQETHDRFGGRGF
jgi:3-hydroxyisobutyrate dehydrogenase